MIVVTGAAGFIGSGIVAYLNSRGRDDLLLVDHLSGDQDPKRHNLSGKRYEKYMDKEEFIRHIRSAPETGRIQAIIHMGACSSTTLSDEKYFEENNYRYTVDLASWAVKHNVRFIYASSAATYGNGERGYSDDDQITLKLRPLNFYAHSKHKFDLYALRENWQSKMVGLKFFNVYGPNEYHKEQMRSLIAQSYPRIVNNEAVLLFKSYRDGYKDGGQKRDFVYVKDAIDVVLFFLDHPDKNGIFNVGTGIARTWNDLASAIFKAVQQPTRITYIEMPETMRDKYQYYTQADMTKLRAAGYTRPFTPLEDAISDYVGYLSSNKYL